MNVQDLNPHYLHCVKPFQKLRFLFAQTFTSADDSPRDVETMLSVVDKLHDPIDGTGIANHPFYKRLVINLTKLQVKAGLLLVC